MEQRRFKDIVAFKEGQNAPMAFHARNLEVAEISEELWNQLENGSDASLQAQIEAWELENSPEVLRGKSTRNIRQLILNVTQICNLKCTYCAAGGDGSYGSPQTRINVEKTLPQIKFFLERIAEGETFKIQFLGGEPLLYPDGIQEIGNYVRMIAAERNITAQFGIVTNGTLITDRALEVLTSLNMGVTVSIDGPAEINDRMRPAKNGQGSTAMTLAGLKKLAAVKSSLRHLGVHGVFNTENTDLVAAFEFYRSLNVDSYEFTFAVDENDDDSNRLFVEQMNLVAKKAYAEDGEQGLRKISLFEKYFDALDKQQQTENHCGAGKSFLMIDARNGVFTCPWDVNDKSEKVGQGTIINDSQLEEYAAPLIEKNNCGNCWARFMCGGGCMFIHKQATGNKHKKDGQFCYRTRSLVATALKYYKHSRIAS
ncbi:radical SAM/SPASM domain-containing protein [Bdellovibrio bacteriovorus]|uniref:Radical SAM/SPASM domain-containing protein n=1 Tax=Bdellovibrio bacteriovorus TaxID=959 RepID=A0A150WSW3_BDEBC|nr:radical SAM protein [Bdellovibrio bacteriovorus]KYG67457.1 radical SAM/SPASM domain-containing protein [Bdellovibrio bacteriovorus]